MERDTQRFDTVLIEDWLIIDRNIINLLRGSHATDG